jgi:AraC-like DNA-binding protein
VARRTAIRDLPYAHNVKPGLGVELLSLADLFVREKRGELPVALATPTRPEFHSIYLGTRGRGTIIIDFTPVPLAVGQATIVARGRVEQFVPASGLDAWMILFSPEFVTDSLRLLAPTWEQPTVELDAADRRDVASLIDQLAVEQERPLDAVQPALLASLLRTILLRLERRVTTGATSTPELDRFFTILERDCQTTRSVEHYARAAGISPRRLGELLAAHTGRSTKQVIDERVVLEQKRLLAHTEIKVKELAARTGFDEPSNLVKFFRHHTGITPLAFRRNLPSGRRS